MAKTELFDHLVASSFDYALSMPSDPNDLSLQVHSTVGVSFGHVTAEVRRLVDEQVPRFAEGSMSEHDFMLAVRDLMASAVQPFLQDATLFGRVTMSVTNQYLRAAIGEDATATLLSAMRLATIQMD